MTRPFFTREKISHFEMFDRHASMFRDLSLSTLRLMPSLQTKLSEG